MFIDSQLLLSDAQALTATADSTNVIDLGSDRDVGRGCPMALFISVDVAADVASGNETYQFQLETDDNAGMSSSTIVADATIDKTALTAGSRHVIPMGITNERYLQGVYTIRIRATPLPFTMCWTTDGCGSCGLTTKPSVPAS